MTTRTTAKTSRLVGFAVTTALATSVLAGCAGGPAPSAHMAAAKPLADKGKASGAVSAAEAAVLAAPRDAAARTQLANAYLEAGRFVSAAATFGDAVELGDTAPRTIISYALALVGTGDQQAALRLLVAHEAALDAADYGLALALAGNPQQGAAVLASSLRAGDNTPKMRQNLAYAFALAGDWRSARLMAAEDVPADQVGDRMAEWAQMVSPDQSVTRVAALLDVRPVADSGQPVALALANFPAGGQPALAAAEPAPAAEPGFAFAGELPALDAAPVADHGEAALADASLTAPAAPAVAFVPSERVQTVAAAAPAPAAPASFREAFAPATRAPAPSAGRIAMSHGDYAIQLGSFSSMSAAHDAWTQFQRRYPELGGAEKVVTKARVNGKIYYRVAATGFARASANSMCSKVKGQGGACLAYASSRPLPGAIRGDIRVASR